LGRKGLVHNTERMYLLTGTPVLNRPIELFTAMSVLASRALKPYDNWYRYVYRFCGAYKDRMGRLHVNGATNLPDLKKRLEKFMIRRLADDTLPEVTYTDVELDVDICISEQDPVATRRRETGLQKVPQAVSFIKDILEEVDKVVIIFYHREVVVNLAEELIKYGTLVVMGGMSAEMKDIAIQDFYNSRRRVFFLQINCAEGLDGLQHNAHVGIFVEQEWSPSIAKQAVGRLHRSGQSHPVLIYNLITTNSLDERIEEVLDRKEKIIGELI